MQLQKGRVHAAPRLQLLPPFQCLAGARDTPEQRPDTVLVVRSSQSLMDASVAVLAEPAVRRLLAHHGYERIRLGLESQVCVLLYELLDFTHNLREAHEDEGP